MFLILRLNGKFLAGLPKCSNERVMVRDAAVAMMALPISSMMTGRPALGPMKVCTTGRQNAPMFSPDALSI